MFIVGIWLPSNKIKLFNLEEKIANYKCNDIKFKLLDLDVCLEKQGPFDLIVHRVADLAIKEKAANQKRLENFKNYIRAHPETQVADNLDLQISLMDREIQMTINKKCAENPSLNGRAFVPAWSFLKSNNPEDIAMQLKKDNVSFPIMCKPEAAQGHSSAHDMCIIFNEQSIPRLKIPCIAQTFVNHDAKLIKIYTMGPWDFLFERRSVKNLYPGDSEPLYFHTHDISKGKPTSTLVQLDVKESAYKPDPEFLHMIGQACRESSGLDFFGVDVILDNESGKYGIVDMNTFPGYDEIDFFDHLIRYVKWRLNIPSINGCQ